MVVPVSRDTNAQAMSASLRLPGGTYMFAETTLGPVTNAAVELRNRVYSYAIVADEVKLHHPRTYWKGKTTGAPGIF
jgi:hypothetical protein